MRVLALNVGSDSLKHKLIDVTATPGASSIREEVLKEGSLDHAQGPKAVERAARVVAECLSLGLGAIGCRVVHGGERFTDPVRVTPEVTEAVRALAPLAPLHVPTDLDVIKAASAQAPGVPIIAVFDTAFHQAIPAVASRYAIPDDAGTGLRRYGFHGIAHQYVANELPRLLHRDQEGFRLISVHLGGGASACAVRGGQSVDTSMGLTPLEGLVMSTRSGDLDPGLVLHLIRQGKTPDEVEELLTRRSGLLGISNLSSDIRDLEPAAAAGNPRAALALNAHAYRVRKYIGAYAAVLGGVDAVSLSGALAENSAGIRQRSLAGLEFLGLRLDDRRNREAGPDAPARISEDGSPVEIWLVPADEERQIARETLRVLGG